MNSILFIISVITTALIGFFALCVTEKNKQIFNLHEKFALSFPLGAGIIAFYLFYISVIGLNINLVSIIPLFIIGIFGILKIIQAKKGLDNYISLKEQWIKLDWKNKGLLIIFTIAIIWKLSVMFFNAFVIPPFFDDAISCWSYKAKVIYFNSLLEMDPENPLFLGGAYSRYPLGSSLFRVWIATVMGSWQESYIQLHSFLMLISIILIVFINLQEYASLLTRMISSYVIASIPLFSTHAYAGYADIILSCYITVAFILLIKWFFQKENRILIIAGISMAMAIFTKNEGLVLYLPSFLLIFSFYCHKAKIRLYEQLKPLSLLLFTIFIIAGPWILFKIFYGIPLW